MDLRRRSAWQHMLPAASFLIAATAAAATCTAAFAVASSWSEAPSQLQQALRGAPAGRAGLQERVSAGHAFAAADATKSEIACLGCALLVAGSLALAGRVQQRHRGATSKAQLRAWGDDVVFHEASVKANVEAGEGLRLITLAAPGDVTSAYKKGGQFVQVKPAADAKPGFYAISSPPNDSAPLEFLIKEVESNGWLTKAAAGDVLQCSAAMGKGFAMEGEAWTGADVAQVGLFATGSGVAPLRAVIESGALDGKVARLYLGARREATLPFSDRFAAWTKRGIEVVPVLSKAGGSWSGRKGYIQDAFKEDEERGEGFVLAARHGALLCGQKEMVVAVREVYEGLGVPEERTLCNF
eukprot:TRINITY_DN123738_c0_g1_i1.p1 TRINITY_DN123738_c0_g1~~TRINITY_DN123738_c0_g1_i1.p1  ORF type:complete len:376 (+),score=106.62 TRINITY_DN123738_c0_g1_i1:65-1129(+)